MPNIWELASLIILSEDTKGSSLCILDSVIKQVKEYSVITNNERDKARYKMRAYTHFDSLKRARLLPTSKILSLVPRQWSIAGGISFYYNNIDDDIWVHVPNGFVTSGPCVPSIIRRFISPKSKIFKAGIIHDYLMTKRKIKIRGYTYTAIKKEADVVFLQAMKIAGVPHWQQVLMFYAAKLSPDPHKCDSLF